MTAMEPTTPAMEFGEHLTALHVAAGKPSFGSISRTILLNTDGKVSVSDQQIGLYHHGRTNPSGVRVEVLIALCRFYGCTSSALGPVAAAEIAVVTDLTSSDEGFSRRACYGDTRSPFLTPQHDAAIHAGNTLPLQQRSA